MEYKDILKIIAPCGLNCENCLSYKYGKIKYYSTKLKEILGNFRKHASKYEQYQPLYKNYSHFDDILTNFTGAKCRGCRNLDCEESDYCGVMKCYEKQKMDFCFQCDEFPCNKSNLDDHLKKVWIKSNQRMKEVGVEAFYEEVKEKPHYL